MTTLDELHQLISQGENTRVELKREPSDSVLQQLSTSLAALANAEGGMIIFGVTDLKDPAGCILKGGEKERISQEASNCQPAVDIELEQIPFGTRSYLVIKVPRSKIVHNDSQRKFPRRLGNITTYLDVSGLVSLLEERGLGRSHSFGPFDLQQQINQGTSNIQKREQLPPEDLNLLIASLENSNASIRLEAVRDLTQFGYRQVILEHQAVLRFVKNILKSGNPSEIGVLLDSLRYIAQAGTSKEREAVTSLADLTAEIGKASTPDIARKAFDVLQTSRNPAAVEVLVHWIKKADDTAYAALQATNMVANMSHFGLRVPVRKALFDLIENSDDERAKKRASEVLQAVRQGYS